MTCNVIFIHGPAAAGKHTIGSLVASRLGLPLFHNHLTVDLVHTLFDFGTDGFCELREAIWLASFTAASRTQQSLVFTFHPEATVRRQLIDEMQKVIEQNGGKVHYIELLCSNDEIENRIGNTSRTRFGKLTDRELFRQISDQGGFDFLPLPKPLLTVDTEQRSAEESAEAIVNALNLV